MALRLLAILTLGLVLASPGFAQRDVQADEAQTAAARALFAEGVEAAHRGDHSAAADRFERALALRWAPPIAYNLAEALAQAGRYVEAIEHLRSVERAAEASNEMKASAAARRVELQPLVARLRVTLAPGEPGLEIRVNGRVVPDALRGVAFPVDPGVLAISVRRGAREVRRSSATVGPGAEASVHIVVAPSMPTPEEAAAAAERQRAEAGGAHGRVEPGASQRRRRRLGGALGVVGAVVVSAIIIGIVVALRPEAEPRLDGNFDPPRLQGPVEGVTP